MREWAYVCVHIQRHTQHSEWVRHPCIYTDVNLRPFRQTRWSPCYIFSWVLQKKKKKKSLMILRTSINFGIRFYSSWRTFKIRHFYRMWGVWQIISKRGKYRLLIRQLLLHSLKMNFCQSVTATWVSDVPSLSIPSTIIPLHFRL